ncbi:Bifunctional (p)ppGpp synthase/hydrolase RelA [Cardinium endosymbiont of Culicoides punctatus]|nr:Bifunctional (p)ppGpp synthase/hydrolase RelA [Cardinium endosymbiont of Culicoides punctatus]
MSVFYPIIYLYHHRVGVGDRSAIVLQWQECKRWWKRQWNNIQMVFTTEYFASCFPNKASSFMLWGGYFMGSALLSLCFIEKGYFEHYFYWYIALIEISIIIFAYPSSTLYFSKPRIMYFIWPVLLFMLFFVTGIQLAKMGHFRPMACALLICHFMASTCFFARKISIIMLAAAVALHTYISFDIPWDNIHWILLTEGPTWELMAASLLAGIAIAGFGTYKYLNDRASARAKVMKVADTYERRLSLQAIHNQINWYRLAPIQHSAMLRDINETLKKPYNYLIEQHQHKMGEELAGVMKKIRKTGSLLLQRDKEERSLRINEKAIQSVDIASIISKAHNNIHDLGEPLQLLVYYQSKVKTIETDPELLERLLTINLLAISKSEHAVDPLVNLVIRSTNLHYNDANHRLPALAFRMSTNIDPEGIYVVSGEYLLLDEGTPIFLPRTETELYQSESKQIVQAHGGYSEIIENEDSLTCLYVLPVAGKSVMQFTNHDPADMSNKIAETRESLAQERELVAILTTSTRLKAEVVKNAIAFIKNAHGSTKRKSGEPYYTHPMAVAKILVAATQDPDIILAGLLHDVVEDTSVTLEQIQLMYGDQVAYIVDMVTHYNTLGYRWKLNNNEIKELLFQCKDIRVSYIKLADRLHNIRTLSFRTPEDQKRIARETTSFYIPWGYKNATILRIDGWLSEMQQICEEILGTEKEKKNYTMHYE